MTAVAQEPPTQDEIREVAREVVQRLRDQGAVESAVAGWVKHTKRPRGQCVTFVAAPPVGDVCFARDIEGMPVDATDAKTRQVYMRLFAVDVRVVERVLRPFLPARRREVAQEIRRELGVLQGASDLTVALVADAAVLVVVARLGAGDA